MELTCSSCISGETPLTAYFPSRNEEMGLSCSWFLRTLAVHSPNKEPIPSQTLSLPEHEQLFQNAAELVLRRLSLDRFSFALNQSV